jgi:phosphoribosylanthranilate isomerase
MRERYNIEALTQLPIEFIGLIFYPKSSRYIFAEPSSSTPLRRDRNYETTDSTAVDLGYLRMPIQGRGNFPKNIQKVGVFVDEEIDQVLNYVHSFQLDYVQLHGNENVFYCKALKDAEVKIIKAFSVDQHFTFTITKAFEYYCDYFLFDTKGKLPGGNGFTFDWSVLEKYYGNTPFFLSGGLAPGMEEKVLQFEHEQFFALDLNSGFENYPGFKNVDMISEFLHKINSALSARKPDW